MLSYEGLTRLIEAFSLSIYKPSNYIVDEQAKQRLEEEKQRFRFNQLDRERFLIGMVRTNFLKRLESSAHSLTKTLERTVGKIDDLLNKIDLYEQKTSTRDTYADVLPDEDENDEEFFVNRARHPYHLRELDLISWKADLLDDRNTLASALDKVKAITPKRDGKLKEIREHIRSKIKEPLLDQDGVPNRKMLVFTTFKDTAEYLYDNLKDLTDELQVDMALVSGDMTRTTTGHNNFNAILTNFATACTRANQWRCNRGY